MLFYIILSEEEWISWVSIADLEFANGVIIVISLSCGVEVSADSLIILHSTVGVTWTSCISWIALRGSLSAVSVQWHWETSPANHTVLCSCLLSRCWCCRFCCRRMRRIQQQWKQEMTPLSNTWTMLRWNWTFVVSLSTARQWCSSTTLALLPFDRYFVFSVYGIVIMLLLLWQFTLSVWYMQTRWLLVL